MENLVLIDGNSLINRAFYATPPMSNSKGETTNAVFGFLKMLIKISEEIKPEYMLVAFDRKEPTFRHKLFDEYKGKRKPNPPELITQIALLKSVLDSLDVKRFEMAGIEADDIIGTLAKRFDCNTIIYTGDKDSLQLVDDSTQVYFTKRGISEVEVYSEENFIEKTGIKPIQIIDLKACMGDSSDNIPGIAGVGEKTALELVKKYGTLENIYNHIDELKGKLKDKVCLSKDIAFLSKTLATMNINVDCPYNLKDLSYSFPYKAKARQCFVDLEFKSVLKQSGIFVEDENIKEVALPESVNNIVTNDLAQSLAACKSKRIAINIGEGISFFDGVNEITVAIKQTLFDTGISYDEALMLLKPVLEDLSQTVILFSYKKTAHELSEYGINIKCNYEDVSLMKYVLSATGKEEKLEELSEENGLPLNSPAFSLSRLFDIYSEELRNEKTYSLYNDVEKKLGKVLFEMEENGFKIDEKILDEMNKKYNAELKEISENIYLKVGEKFNLNSTKQLGEILYEKLNLKRGKKTKTGFSTNIEALEALQDEHEVIPLIIRYRKLSKLNSTYVEGFKAQIDKKTGLVHTIFNQTLTTTGRLSSKEPNLQNIPIREEEGRQIRKFFVPRDEEHILVGADYSQIELRLLAHFSECKELIDAYNSDGDIHALTASEVFGVPLSEVTKQMRSSAKAVNFGIIYGISAFGLANNIKTTPKKAEEYIKKYFETYPHVLEYMESNVDFARKNGYVSTLLGRRRYMRDINSPSFQLRSFSERAAKNMPLQGSSADIIKLAMVNVYERMKKEGLKSLLILQVHDELVIDALKSEKEQIKKLLKEEMENAVKLKVKLVAEVYEGENLYQAK